MTCWIYFLGERSGADIKVGKTDSVTVRPRLGTVNGEQTADHTYVLLVAVRGTPNDEATLLRSFRRQKKGRKTEYLEVSDELVGYVNWLRYQWFVTLDADATAADVPEVPSDRWLPAPGRTIPRPDDNPAALIPDYIGPLGPLVGTPWAWMVNPETTFDDYFTPLHIVDAARKAMGDIDLDAAGHWFANKTLQIPDYFDANRSAFKNRWYGRVWLNPPYGENPQWFAEIERWVRSGDVTQLCMISPVWAFTTKAARPVMDLASSLLLLSPTPKFWGNKNPAKVGVNHPHAVIYIGDRTEQFHDAFGHLGKVFNPHFGFDDEFIPTEQDPD